MPTYIYLGRLIPEQLEPTLAYSPTIDRIEAEGDAPVRYEGRIERGRLVVRVTAPNDSEDAPREFFANALDMARSLADVICLETGVAFLPVLDEVVLPSEVRRPLALADRRLATITSDFVSANYETVVDLALTDVKVARLLSDVTSMLTWSHYAPIAAGRVADSVVRLLTDGRSSRHWEEAREILRMDRAYLQLLTNHAAPPRHGDRQSVPGEANSELARRAWTIMVRYLEYRLSGDLDPAKHPLLVG
jgi:hypothetical protein